jgi:two-component system sensor histidine kinase MprB
VALAVGVTVALASLASYIAVHHEMYKQVDSALETELNAFVDPSGQFNSYNAARVLSKYANSTVQVVDANGNSLLATNAPSLPFNSEVAALATSEIGGYHFRNVTYQGQPYRVLSVGATSGGTPAVVQIGRSVADINHTLSDLRLVLWLVSLSGVGAAVALGYLVGRATMRPVVRLTGAAEHVAATQDLAASIDEQGDDELARLARAFNSMLAALAASRQQQSQLISDAGHELRTPLTSLRTNIEVLMRVRDLPESDRQELMGDVQAQLEELTTLVGDVVELARDDELGQHVEPIEVRFDSIVAHAVERARRRAPGVTFDTTLTAGSVRAIPALLERAVLNVLDNAAKWSPPSGTVEVRLSRDARWTLEVRDHGPGIAPADLPHIFDRFYRAEQARAMPGSGLGLAIVRQVVTTHGGNVSASSPLDGGTVIHIELPIVAESEPERDNGPDDEDGPVFTPWGTPPMFEPQPQAGDRPHLPEPQLSPTSPGSSPAPSAFGPPSPVFAPTGDFDQPRDEAARPPGPRPGPGEPTGAAERNGSGPSPRGDAEEPETSPFAPPVSPFSTSGGAGDTGEPSDRDALDHIHQR